MAGKRKTIYLSEDNMRILDTIKDFNEARYHKMDKAEMITQMIKLLSLTMGSGISKFSEEAMFAIGKGEFDKLMKVDIPDIGTCIIIKPENKDDYKGDYKFSDLCLLTYGRTITGDDFVDCNEYFSFEKV